MINNIRPSYDTERCQLGKAVPLDTPFRLTLDSSEICNLRCSYCFRSGKPSESWGYAAKNNIMDIETFRLAVNQISEFPSKPKVVALSGSGEPLCNKNIAYMAEYIRKLGCAEKTEIHTNAVLLNKDNVKEFAECGIDKIVISLQGITAEAYEKTCSVKIDFDEFYSNLELLYRYKAKNTIINIKIVDKALESAEENKLFYKMFSPISDNVFIENVVALWQEQLDYGENDNSSSNKFGADFGKIECCPIVFTNLTISPDGDIWPCCVIRPPFSLGNIKNISMADAWNSNNRRELMRNNMLRGNMGHENCKNCYFPKGYVKSELDILDPYRMEILERLSSM